MPLCKVCGTKFHACSSCGLEHQWEYEYCNMTCWKASDIYKDIHKTCKDVAEQLSTDIKQKLLSIVSNDDYQDIFIEYLMKGK